MGSDSGFLLICVCAWGGWTIQPPFLPHPQSRDLLGAKEEHAVSRPQVIFPLGVCTHP